MPALVDGWVGAHRAYAVAVIALAAWVGGASGCISPNIYGTPRTLPRGATSHTLAPESITAVTHGPMKPGSLGRSSDGSAILPSYTLRVGLAERADMGLRAAQLGFWGVDLKLNALKSRSVDLAIDPTVQMVLDGSTGHLHLPGIVGFNVAEDVTIIVTAGISYASNLRAGLGTGAGPDGPADIRTYGLLGRFGAGVNFRFQGRFAIHPEATMFRSLQPSHDAPYQSITWLALGVGLTLGAQPSFADDDPGP